jgi:crotonobetainyl-CoA:carnitine CoA-transferase CaiB-like acyl-CoA transferase
MGKVKCPTAPYRFSQTPHRFHHPAPMLGEHNEEIFVNRLGYSKEDLIRMRGAGVI